MATLAGFLSDEDEAEIVDQHVQALDMADWPDVVAIQVYITNAYRAYAIADAYRRRGIYVVLGGLHVTSLPEEAAWHADTIIMIVPIGSSTNGHPLCAPVYFMAQRSIS